jgi:uncharacterized glyoxalase superfamily protein PhnB
MKILDVTPMLTVVSVEVAVAFYRDVLGFELVLATSIWACVERDGVEVMFALPNAHLPFERPLMTGSIYFNVDDADTLWASFRDRCEVVYPVADFPYGMREFAIRDNSGYLLQFGQRIF